MAITPQITLTLAILLLAIILFISERIRVDLVALLVLSSLAVTGLVTPSEALSGFSNPAVVTVWAVFILSGSMSRTGVANVVGRQVLRLAGQSDVRLLVVIMLSSGLMSAFMNNIGVAALFLPVVMDIARRTNRAPSKLLMPLAFGCLLGGLTTQIGTPANILASDALRDYGLRPFQFFDFTPVGLIVMLSGITFMALIGRHLLPVRDLTKELRGASQADPGGMFDLRNQIFVVHLPADSGLAGKTLTDSRLGAVLNLNVIGIIRDGQTRLVPDPNAVLRADDRLLVVGSQDQLTEMNGRQQLVIEDKSLKIENLISTDVEIAEVGLSPFSSLIGQSIGQIGFRHRYKVNVLAVWKDGDPHRSNLHDVVLHPGNTLLVQAASDQLDALRDSPDFLVSSVESIEIYRLHERLLMIGVPQGSNLAGKTLAESHLGDAFGLTVLGIIREGATHLIPEPGEQLRAGDTLLAEGKHEDVLMLRYLQDLEVERDKTPDLGELESESIGMLEAVLSPHTTLAGKTLRAVHFREKYSLNVLAIWRNGKAYRTNLRDMALRFGDAILLYGRRDKLKVLGEETDFLLLAEEIQEEPRLKKAPLSALFMFGIVLSVLLGWLPISIAAIVGASLVILTGCLNMDEAYRYIEWRAVFLIAGMLPLGIAMETSGAARFLAEGVISIVGGFGPTAILVSLFVLTSLASQFMPNAVVTVLMAPIAINTALNLSLSPYALMMVVALAASTSFLSPVGHPANLLIMGPGGYRFSDYIKVGLPLTLVVLVVTMLALPVFWPLIP